MSTIMDPVAKEHAPWALWLLSHAVDAYGGRAFTQNVSTTTQADVASSSTRLVVSFEHERHKVHASIVVDESTYAAQVPAPRTSLDQATWVRDTLRRVLEAPEGRPHVRRDDARSMLDAYEMMDREGARQGIRMEIHHTAGTPLGTGGTHLCIEDGHRTLSDRTSTVPGAVEVVLTRRQHDFLGSTTVIHLEANSHTTAVPMADALERLRLMRDLGTGRTIPT